MNELLKRLREWQTPSAPIIKEAADMLEQQAGEIERLKDVAAEMAEALEHFGGDPIADEPLGKWKELNK